MANAAKRHPKDVDGPPQLYLKGASHDVFIELNLDDERRDQ